MSACAASSLTFRAVVAPRAAAPRRTSRAPRATGVTCAAVQKISVGEVIPPKPETGSKSRDTLNPEL
jgi:hypothetical protein